MASCVDDLELLEELPLELDDLPLWCEELYEDDEFLPFLPLTFELELLRIFSGVLSKSSCCCCLLEWLLLEDWCTFSDRLVGSLELVVLRASPLLE